MELRDCSFGEAEDINEPATYITPHQLTSPAAIIADLAAQTWLSPLSLRFRANYPFANASMQLRLHVHYVRKISQRETYCL